MPFLENLGWPEINSSVDFRSNEMAQRADTKLLPREEASSIQESDWVEEPFGVEINFISGKPARHELRRGEGFLAEITEADKEQVDMLTWKNWLTRPRICSGQRTKLIDLLDEFSDVK